jgi:O-antigen/teichoic acid export membrane protein
VKSRAQPTNSQPTSPRRTTTRTVAANSFWYGSETLIAIALLFATSIPLARIIGPEKLGYFNYIAWLTAMSTTLGSLGIPSTCGKFMAEYIGRREEGVVHAIFFAGLRMQTVLAVFITVVCLGIDLVWGDPRYRTVTTLQILSIFPGMVMGVPSLANVAAERMRANFPGSIASSVIYVIGVTLSLWFGWNLVGVAAAFLISRCTDMTWKLLPCLKWMMRLPDGSISPSLRVQMRSFGQQQLVLMILGLIIWDRSDVVLLKMLSPDIRQVTFFTVAYNLSEKLLLAPRVFGVAVAASLMAQFGRDNEKMNEMAVIATRYMFLLGTPLLVGMALISPSLILVLYGHQYTPAIPVLAAGCIFAVFKSVVDPADSILRANNRQGPVVITSLFCAFLNIFLDWILIPAHGAFGAAIGNGIAQTLHVLSYWAVCIAIFPIRLDFAALGKIAFASAAMAPPVLLCNFMLPPLPALLAGAVTGAIVFPVVLRLTSFFEPEDRTRLDHLTNAVPSRMQPAVNAMFSLLIPVSQE